MSKFMKNLALFLIIAFVAVALFNLFESAPRHGTLPLVAYSDFIAEVNKGQVKEVMIAGKMLNFQLADGRSAATVAPDDPALIQRLLDKNVVVQAALTDDNPPTLLSILVSWLPLLGVAGFYFYFFRQIIKQMQKLNEQIGRIVLNRATGIGHANQDAI